MARWFSIHFAVRFWDPHWHTKLFLIVWVSLRKSWAKSLKGILVPTEADVAAAVELAKDEPEEDGVTGPAHVESAPSGSAVASSSAAPPPPETTAPKTSKAAAQAASKREIDKVRKRSENTLHAVGRLMANPDLLHRLRMVHLCSNAWSMEYGEFSSAMRSPENTQVHYYEWAHWSS
eukprot:6465392-Amphidinium_carterae.1